MPIYCYGKKHDTFHFVHGTVVLSSFLFICKYENHCINVLLIHVFFPLKIIEPLQVFFHNKITKHPAATQHQHKNSLISSVAVCA